MQRNKKHVIVKKHSGEIPNPSWSPRVRVTSLDNPNNEHVKPLDVGGPKPSVSLDYFIDKDGSVQNKELPVVVVHDKKKHMNTQGAKPSFLQGVKDGINSVTSGIDWGTIKTNNAVDSNTMLWIGAIIIGAVYMFRRK